MIFVLLGRRLSWFIGPDAMNDGEEPGWDPDDEVVLERKWNPRALRILRGNPDFAKYKAERSFRFVHLFSGPKDVLKAALLDEAIPCWFPVWLLLDGEEQRGGPPPVRSRDWPYGLPSNTDMQQKEEAHRGTVLAALAVVAAKALDHQRTRRVGEVATLENPPGAEVGPDVPAWELQEVLQFLEKYRTSTAAYTWTGPTGGGSPQSGRAGCRALSP